MKPALFILLAAVATPLLATTTVSATGLISALVWLIIVGLIFGLLWWLVDYIGLPAPFNKIARILIAFVAVLILINFLLGFVGAPVVSVR